jgi:hypothetical protein
MIADQKTTGRKPGTVHRVTRGIGCLIDMQTPRRASVLTERLRTAGL